MAPDCTLTSRIPVFEQDSEALSVIPERSSEAPADTRERTREHHLSLVSRVAELFFTGRTLWRDVDAMADAMIHDGGPHTLAPTAHLRQGSCPDETRTVRSTRLPGSRMPRGHGAGSSKVSTAHSVRR